MITIFLIFTFIFNDFLFYKTLVFFIIYKLSFILFFSLLSYFDLIKKNDLSDVSNLFNVSDNKNKFELNFIMLIISVKIDFIKFVSIKI